jgi:hypothetical protein
VVPLVFKHEALLTFVGRLIHDREFCEWFVARPTQALSSHGLTQRDVQDMADVLASDRHRPRLSEALRPTVGLLLEMIEGERLAVSDDRLADRVDRINQELRLTSDRLAVARSEERPWWKFWEW